MIPKGCVYSSLFISLVRPNGINGFKFINKVKLVIARKCDFERARVHYIGGRVEGVAETDVISWERYFIVNVNMSHSGPQIHHLHRQYTQGPHLTYLRSVDVSLVKFLVNSRVKWGLLQCEGLEQAPQARVIGSECQRCKHLKMNRHKD